jgi:hypothetical protein
MNHSAVVRRLALGLWGEPDDKASDTWFYADRKIKVVITTGRVIDFGNDGRRPRLGIYAIAERTKGLAWMREVLEQERPPAVTPGARTKRKTENASSRGTTNGKEATSMTRPERTHDEAAPQAQQGRPASDKFARRRFDWLDKLAREPRLPHLAFRLAYVISGFVNRDSGDAWPGQGRLASEIGVDERTIRNNINRLVELGHLEVTAARGRGNTNRYRPAWAPTDDDGAGTVPQQAAARPRRQRAAASDSDFDRFWSAYPRKVDKGAARKTYDSVLRSGKATPDELLNGAMRYAAERTDQDPKFTKHPKTWLNAESWKNEPQASRPEQQPRGAMSAVRGIYADGEG